MASWVTPIIDWDGVTANRKWYNFEDLDRAEENTEYIVDEFVALGYTIASTTFTYPRTRTSFDHYYDDLNRIENNILAIKNGTWEPLTWVTPYVAWLSVDKGFGYIDANRIEQNLYYLKEMLDNLKESIRYSGTFYSGDAWGELFTDWGLM